MVKQSLNGAWEMGQGGNNDNKISTITGSKKSVCAGETIIVDNIRVRIWECSLRRLFVLFCFYVL